MYHSKEVFSNTLPKLFISLISLRFANLELHYYFTILLAILPIGPEDWFKIPAMTNEIVPIFPFIILKYMKSVQNIQPSNMKNWDIYWRRYKIQKTLSIGHWCLSPLKVGTLEPHTVLPITISCPVVFSWISPMVWNLFPFKGDFSFGKSQKSQGTKSGL